MKLPLGLGDGPVRTNTHERVALLASVWAEPIGEAHGPTNRGVGVEAGRVRALLVPTQLIGPEAALVGDGPLASEVENRQHRGLDAADLGLLGVECGLGTGGAVLGAIVAAGDCDETDEQCDHDGDGTAGH